MRLDTLLSQSTFCIDGDRRLPRLVFELADLNNESDIERFYNAAITQSFHVTADMQVVDISIGQTLSNLIPFIGPGGLIPLAPGVANIQERNTAWIGGLRATVSF